MIPISASQFLAELQRRGAPDLVRVSLRENRSTLWSVTGAGRVLNVHVGYAVEPASELFDAFATLLRDPAGRTQSGRSARQAVRRHPHLETAFRLVERKAAETGRGRRQRPGRNCATPAQQEYLQRVYDFLNTERFAGRLARVPLRLSDNARRTLGWVVPETGPDGTRSIRELVLAAELMLERNDALRLDTLVHEMAHVAAWLLDGDRGHGRAWKRWARHAGCSARSCTPVPVARRRRRDVPVTRVPPLPGAANGGQLSLF
jgi:hypothetical protein